MARISSAALRRNEGHLFSLVEKELSPRDEAGLDQFDVGGAEATEDLARLLAPLPAIHVLDVENVGTPLRDETADRYFWH